MVNYNTVEEIKANFSKKVNLNAFHYSCFIFLTRGKKRMNTTSTDDRKVLWLRIFIVLS